MRFTNLNRQRGEFQRLALGDMVELRDYWGIHRDSEGY